MTAPLSLLAFALLLAVGAIPWLGRSAWPRRAPALGIIAWQTVTASIMLSLALTGLSLAVPELRPAKGLAEFLHACSRALQDHYSTPAGVGLSVAGGTMTVVMIGRLAWFLSTGFAHARGDRNHQRDLLAVVATSHPAKDVVVVQHDTPTVYCVPGRRRQIVVTSAALAALTDEQLTQVLAHERAHIRARHHLTLLLADAVSATFFHRSPFALARHQIAELTEMHADDAADPCARRDLAAALVVLAGGARPAGALGANGAAALARVRRLTEPTNPLARPARILLLSLSGLSVVLPLAIAVAPGVSAVVADYCPVVFGA